MNKLTDFVSHQMLAEQVAACADHGEYTSRNLFRNVWSGCPKCAANEKAIAQREADEKAAIERFRAWERKLGEAGIPERFRDRTLDSYRADNPKQRAALAFAQVFAGEFDQALRSGRSAIFCGKPGTGKTHLAVGIALVAMSHHHTAQFTTVMRAIRRVKDSWRKDSCKSESDVIAQLVDTDLLILDEVGVQFGSEFEKNLMFDILNERYESHRPTLLLSNLNPDEVRAFLGERVYDRLREDGGKCVPFDWDSYRGRSA